MSGKSRRLPAQACRPNEGRSEVRYLSRSLVLGLCLFMVVPPPLLAQTLGGSSSMLGGQAMTLGGLPGSPPLVNPDMPVVTHPSALQPIVPSQTPCPTPASPTTSLPPSPQWGGAQLADSARAGANAALGQAAGPPAGSPGSTASSQTGQERGQQGVAALPSHPGLLSPVIQQEANSGGGTALPRQLQPEGVENLSIEAAFSRFFILQGVTGQLKQFGYNFFDMQFSGLPPVMDMPVGPDYILGPEDTLALHIWNAPQASFNRSYIVPIEHDGIVVVPQVGAIPVVGITISQAHRLIHAKLSGLLKHFEMHLSMARLRTIKVYVVGEVVRPGAYEVSSLAATSHALYAACGPSKSGSLRHVQIIREGKVFAELDYYKFFLQGDRSHDQRLRSGDTILVPPIGPVAAIGGPVKRPAIYELLNRPRLHELIDLAGGLSPTADRKHCQIYRIEAGQQRVILDVDLSLSLKDLPETKDQHTDGTAHDSNDPFIADGDFVRIAAVPTQIENAVILTGAVRNPGPFEFRPGMRLKDLLTPEQMFVDSYMERAELVRTDPVSYEVTVRAFSPKELFQGKEDNVELRRLDKVVVATQVKTPRTISLSGEVKRPGAYTIESGERLSSVLKRAGGLTVRAFPQGLIMVRESVRRSQQSELEKFVALQKQKLMVQAASLSAGNTNPQTGGLNQDQIALQIQMQALDQVAARVQPGRVVVRMESLEGLENSVEDVTLEEGDSITIPLRPQTVGILGAVKNPTSVVAYEGLRVEDYIRQAGGFTTDADEKELYILRANGSTDAAYVRLKDVRAGDTIVVPELIEPKTKPLPLWQAIASIIGSIMLGVAAISIIGR